MSKNYALITLLFTSPAFATGHGHEVPRSASTAVGNANATGVGLGYGGTVTNSVNGGQGGQGVGSVNVQGVGNTSMNYPRQTPPAIAPSFYSANPCQLNASAAGAGAPISLSFGIGWEGENCNARAYSIRLQELGLPQAACERVMIADDDNVEAMKRAGLTCKDVQKVAVAIPTAQVVETDTPTLNKWWADKQREIDSKLNNAQRIGVMK